MSTNSNLFSQGGGGTRFEFETHAAFFTAFIIGCSLPGAEDNRIIQYRQQSGSLGYKTDDLLLISSDRTGLRHKHLVQIKHGLVISENNQTWEEVLTALWQDFSNEDLFTKTLDQLIVIKDNLTIKEKKHLKELSNWARVKSDEVDFNNEVFRIDEKKKYYDMFKTVLARKDIEPTSVELFQFFRCFDVIEYDFGNTTSVHRNNFINLISLSRAPGTRLSPVDIWQKIFEFVSGADVKGGSFTWETIPAMITDLFDKSYFPTIQAQIQAITDESKELVEYIDDNIGSIAINRAQLVREASDQLETNQILIFTGIPGSGKSALAKRILTNNTGSLIFLKADELTSSNLVDLLRSKGVDLTVTAFFNHFPLHSRHIIYIDALERLLEGEGKAFKQLLQTLRKHPDIKLIASCRKTSFHLLEIKYFSGHSFYAMDVDVLTDSELNQVTSQLPVLEPMAGNIRLSSLIKVPKYLELAYKAISVSGKTYSEIEEPDFVRDLWEIVVENRLYGNSEGMPQKRRETFIDIAVGRAKAMTPFVAAPNLGAEALEKLEKDNVIIKSKYNHYAPAHDILEDWGLIRFVDRCFENNTHQIDFFATLGTEPAMRRAYRLWIQNVLAANEKKRIDFFVDNFFSEEVDSFWRDESLIALLYSPYSQTFFIQKQTLIMDNDWAEFKRAVQILRMACRENDRDKWTDKRYIPVGPGWATIICFIHTHLDSVPKNLNPLLLQVLEDYATLLYRNDEQIAIVREAGIVSLHLLRHFKEHAQYPYDDETVHRCIKLVFEFCSGIKDEVKALLNQAVEMDDKDERGQNWMQIRYYKKIITLALEGPTTGMLPKEFPDLLMGLATKRWYLQPKTDSGSSLHYELEFSHYIGESEFKYGLNEEEKSYETISALNTFILSLLRHHPNKGIDFIISFTNRVTTVFLSQNSEKHNFKMTLPDNTEHVVSGIADFWVSYQGQSGVPGLIESVLMALEKYLIEFANLGEAVYPEFRMLVQRLYTESKSLLITGVLSSVCQAHPVGAGEWVLPIFTCPDFFYLDLQRSTRMFLSPSFYPIDDFAKERIESLKLEHRTRYDRGLLGFITSSVLYQEGLGERIFAIIDGHKQRANDKDLNWRRWLKDMDRRTYKIQEVFELPDGRSVARVVPDYEPDIAQQVAEFEAKQTESSKDVSDINWMNSVVEHNKPSTLDRWREVYRRYICLPEFSSFSHAPGALAAIGIRYHWRELEQSEKHWAAKFLFDCIPVSNTVGPRQYEMSIYDERPVYGSFVYLLLYADSGLDRDAIDKKLFNLLLDNDHTAATTKALFDSIAQILWSEAPTVARIWWKGLITLSAVTINRPKGYNINAVQSQAYEQILSGCYQNIVNAKAESEIDNISFGTHDPYMLAKAISVLPDQGIDQYGITFLKKIMDLYHDIEQISETLNDNKDRSVIKMTIKSTLLKKIPAIMVHSSLETAAVFMDHILDRVNDLQFITQALRRQSEILTMYCQIFEGIFIEVQKTDGLDKEAIAKQFNHFKDLWQHFDEYITAKQYWMFSDYILINIKFGAVTKHWPPIENMGPFLKEMIGKYGAVNPAPVINLLTFPAHDILLPEAISDLVMILKKMDPPPTILAYPHIETFVQRSYDNYLHEIREDQTILKNFLWLLDRLSSEGSSEAYWTREFLISFRHPQGSPSK